MDNYYKMPLNSEEIRNQLHNLPGWVLVDDKITKEYRFRNFADALKFINLIAPYFEEMDHHADMTMHYNIVIFELQRKDAGHKVTNLDIEVAKTIEEQYIKHIS